MSNMYSIQVTSYKQELTHLILGGDANSLEEGHQDSATSNMPLLAVLTL